MSGREDTATGMWTDSFVRMRRMRMGQKYI